MTRIFQLHHPYKRLERLPLPLRQTANRKLTWFWQEFLGFWHTSPREPRVWKRIDRLGKPYWRVYDPLYNRTLRFEDEQSLMVWLDEQHYRRARPHPWDMDW